MKMIKRVLIMTIAVALLLAQSNIAAAFTSRDKDGTPLTATADLSGEVVTPYLAVEIVPIGGGGAVSEITYNNATLGAGWVKADHRLEVTYVSGEQGWGVQVYTDNKGTTMTANPEYPRDPLNDIFAQPAGLLGVVNTLLTCPMVILTTANPIGDPAADLEVPVEVDTTTLPTPIYPGQLGYGIWFENGYDEVSGGKDEKVWYWLKDLMSTKWLTDDGDGIPEFGEIVKSFNDGAGYPGSDDAATIVKATGIATGWTHPVTDEMIRDSALGTKNVSDHYVMYVYMAAKFEKAREVQEYKTNTLTLELYNE